ncbi:EAL domain-containing protein [Ectothiorhodospiraceae bacterium WFHF3C12]|nr:EAL domain-containing protein [Ectothiorhodospiraceae bacterium WFHF3C12]
MTEPHPFSEQLFATLDAHAIVSITDVSGRIVYANQRFADVSGYPLSELIGENHNILRSGEHDARFYEGMWQAIAQGQTWHGLICNRKRDGGRYWVDTTIVPFTDAHGLPEYYCSIRTEVTALVEARDLLQRSQTFAGVGSWDWRLAENVVSWSAGTAALFGLEPKPRQVDFDAFVSMIHPDDRERLREAVQSRLEAPANAPPYELEHRIVLQDGSVRWLMERGDLVFDASGEPVRMLGLVQDVTERRRAQEQLAQSERRWRALMEQNRDAVLLGTVSGYVMDANSAAERLFGYSREELIGRRTVTLHPEYERAEVDQGIQRVISAGDTLAERHIVRKDGQQRAVIISASLVATGEAEFIGATYRDVTDERLIRESRSDSVSGIDAETGLLNADVLDHRLSGEFARKAGAGDMQAVAVIRLENLAEIDAGFGADIRQAVIIAFAERLRETELDGALAARVGEHEFVIAWQGRHAAVFENALARLAERLRKPFDSAGQAIQPRLAIGTTLHRYAEGPPQLQRMLNRARVACNRAEQSSDTHVAFDRRMERSVARGMRLEQAMRRALENGDFVPAYQPQVDLAEERVCGVEVLARWHDPRLGHVPPGEFIPFAEQTGLLDRVCEVVFSRALADTGAFLAADPRNRVALNVSPVQLRGGGFVRALERIVAASRQPPSQMELEITETAMVEDISGATKVLARWRSDGFRIAIDDFGTGYSSMGNLRLLPVDRIKIDRSFVSSMDANPGDEAIVRSILGLAGPLGYACVAEGIEKRAHMDALRELGCAEGQGYFIARPMAADELAQWLLEGEAPLFGGRQAGGSRAGDPGA